MHRAEGREQGVEGKGHKSLCSVLCALCSKLLTLCCLLLFLYGCSAFTPPDDYYQEVLEIEEHGERVRRETGRRPGDIVSPYREPEPIEVEETRVKLAHQGDEDTLVIEQQNHEEIHEQPPRREPVQEPSSPQRVSSEPVGVAIASEVIKSALNNADLGVRVRTVELVNGRLTGGNNSVRVSFLSESLNVIDDKFVAICAVIYHLDRGKNTIDLVVGIAEDDQANLLAIVQSDMSSIIAWMNNEISRVEWFSMITKKML